MCGIIIAYNPGPTLSENVAALTPQVGQVVIIDNHSSSGHQIRNLESEVDCSIIRNGQNLGVAAALNIGLRHAIEAGFELVCTFDQDSRVCDGFISQMIQTYENAPAREMIAIVSPTYIDRKTGVAMPLRRRRNGEILDNMTSGSMIPLRAIQRLGLFDESLFIDSVDKEFCLRCRRYRMSIIQSTAVLWHSLGLISQHEILGWRFSTSNHSAARRYYITRNRIRLFARYYRDLPWLKQEGREMFTEIAKIVLAEEDKLRKLRAVAKGALDAVIGRMGKRIEL